MTVRAFPQLVPMPWPGSPGPRFMAAVDVRWQPGDDPLPFLRLVAHWQAAGGGEVFVPAVDAHGHVGVLR